MKPDFPRFLTCAVKVLHPFADKRGRWHWLYVTVGQSLYDPDSETQDTRVTQSRPRLLDVTRFGITTCKALLGSSDVPHLLSPAVVVDMTARGRAVSDAANGEPYFYCDTCKVLVDPRKVGWTQRLMKRWQDTWSIL